MPIGAYPSGYYHSSINLDSQESFTMEIAIDHFLPGVTATDTHKRLQAHQDLINFLNDPAAEIQCDDLDQIIDGLASWMNSSNYKVVIIFFKNGMKITLLKSFPVFLL